MVRIFLLILFFLIIAAVSILIPFRVYGANFESTEITQIRNSVKKQLPRAQSKPAKPDKPAKEDIILQPTLPPQEQLPKPKRDFFLPSRPLHPIRRA